MNVIYVTGNAHKAKYFSEMTGLDIEHHSADTTEIQSLDAVEVITAKAEGAYSQIGKPVLVEDASFVINSMGRLPGTFVKWFIEEMQLEGICRLADTSEDRSAVASAIFAYYDGQNLKLIAGSLTGRVAQNPAGKNGFGWGPIFIPDGQDKTLGEMDDETFRSYYSKIKPYAELKQFLDSRN